MKKYIPDVDESLIRENLPTPPDKYHYEIEVFSPLVHRVWIVNESHFNFRDDDEPVRCVWGFVKSNGDVVRPTNRDKISRTVVCDVIDIPPELKYSTIIPVGPRCLTHLK